MSKKSGKPDQLEKGENASKPAKARVIDIVQGAEETPTERMLKKLVPAWVISGALHVAIILTLLLVFNLMGSAVAKDPVQDVTIAADETKEPEPPNEDLTRTDPGLDSTVETALPLEREEKLNVENVVTKDAAIGEPTATVDNPTQDSLKTIGAPADLMTGGTPDLAGPGAGMPGVGGMSGIVGGNPSLIGRSGATKNKLLEQYGGSKESELAVARGLAWLAKQQRQDGTWVFDGSSSEEVGCSTGLALLPFLAAGQTHISKKDSTNDNKYQKNVAAGLQALIKIQQRQKTQDGRLSGNMYAHAIATVALCEAFGMSGDRSQLQRPAQAAINFIMASQGNDGSWGYGPKATGDTSIVGWQLQALQSAKLCKDLTVDKRVLDAAIKFLDRVSSGSSKAFYGYTTPEKNRLPLTAVGQLCRYYLNGWTANNPGMRDGVQAMITGKMPGVGVFDMYYYYYATQVIHFHEGDEWHKVWNPKMRDDLIKRQQVDAAKPATFGSWDRDASHIGSHSGRLGTTCFALLTLEVYYRHIPLYRRDSGGLKELERAAK